MTIESIEKGSQEAVELLLQRAKALCGSALKRMKTKGQYIRDVPIKDMVREIHALEDAIDRFEHGAPQPERIPYKNETRESHGRDEETRETHESFGLISFHRISGSTKLFGSHLDTHHTFIRLEVQRCELSHGLSNDHYFGQGLPLIEVDMSAAQYAEAITTMNMGGGIPCTIRDVVGIQMERVPEEAQEEHAKIRAGFRGKIEGVVKMAEEAHAKGEELLTHKTVSKGRARELVDVLGRVVMEMRSNAPFVINQFQESADRVVTAAKAEVESFTLHALTKVGMKAIADQYGAPELLSGMDAQQLTDGERESGVCESCGTVHYLDTFDERGLCEACVERG